MHDLRAIRENPEAFDTALARRGEPPAAVRVLEIDATRRAAATRMQELQSRRNDASKAIGQAMGAGDKDKAETLKAEVAEIKAKLPELEAEDRELGEQLNDLLARLPNLPHDDVPPGEDESDNVEVASWGKKREFAFKPQEHADLGPALGLDFETGAAISGARFTFLRGAMARLQRALGQFMLDQQSGKNGYGECAPPLLVRDEAAFGTGQLPKFAEDLFQTTEGRWLIPTGEVPLTNAVREQILGEMAEPLRMCALTPCFRSEAGAAGKDTRGFIRQHQFEKVELVAVCRPDQWEAEHEHMVRSAESILEALDLPYRKMLLCAGDMGATAKKTFDLEVWLPGQGAYREISSISWCGDFQARRMNARYKPKPHSDRQGFHGHGHYGDGKKLGTSTQFVHTLNGSGLAVGRTLVAILENFQNEDGTVDIPAVLHPYMGGVTRLEPSG